MQRWRLLFLCCASLMASACGDDAAGGDAAPIPADGAGPADAGPLIDATPQLGWVDFAVTGCESGVGTEAQPCVGASPLTLRFSVLAPADIDTQQWDFGDSSDPDMSPTPEHRYTAPGSYNLSLNVEGPGGTAGVTRLAAVVVIPAPLSAPCDADDHCASGSCACTDPQSCPAVLSPGMCVLDCTTNLECGGNVCAQLDPTAVADEDWRRSTCVPGCTPGAGECDAGQSCQPVLDVDGSWRNVCLAPGLLRPIGASCVDATGTRRDELCASGQCADLGDRGMCTTPCDSVSCPAGSECATFDSAPSEPVCLALCSATSCDGDAQLACQGPGSGFTVDGPPAPDGYCAPLP
jgi:PKD repeat protein